MNWLLTDTYCNFYPTTVEVLSQRQILVTGNLPQDSAPVCINIDISPEFAAQMRNETKHFVSLHLIGPQFLAKQHETNQHESAALIGLFHATSSVLLSVESYQNYRKPTQRGVQGYLSSLQRSVLWRLQVPVDRV